MLAPQVLENVSKHRSYVETGEAVWLKPASKKIVIGEENYGTYKSPAKDGAVVFDITEYERKKRQFDEGKIDRLERALAGYTPEFQPKYQEALEELSTARKQGRMPQYAGLIEPTVFSSLKSTQRIIQVFTQQFEEHNLLDTIRIVNVDDLNGVGIYDVGQIEEDIVQRQGTHTLPYEPNAPAITKTVLSPEKYGWRVAFSQEFALVNFDLPNLEALITGSLNGQIDRRRNKDVATIINAVSSSGTQSDWTTFNTAETRFENSAFDDVKELLNLIVTERYGQPEFIGMHPNVWDAFYMNLTQNQVTGLTMLNNQPYTPPFNDASRKAFGLFPQQQFVVDSLLTDNRLFTWRRDAIFQVFGGIRVVPFENREIGYSGQTVRGYWNTAKIKANLINGGTGILG